MPPPATTTSPTAAKLDGLEIRKADLETDKAKLIAFWCEVFGHYKEARYDWIYRRNPQGALCFILETDNGQIVGAAGVIFRNMRFNRYVFLAAQSIDFAIDKHFRFGGAALALQRTILSTCKTGGVSIIYGIPLPGAEAIQRRAGFSNVGVMERWVLPIDCNYKLRQRCKSPAVSSALSRVFNVWISLKWRRPNHLLSKVNFSKTVGIECADVLSGHSENNTITGEKDYKYLKWRFSEFPMFKIKDREGVLKGHIVYSEINGGVQIRDISGTDKHYVRATLMAFIRFVHRDHPNFIEINILAGEGWRRLLKGNGFRLRDGGKKVLALSLDERATEAFRAGSWFLTDADKDV